MDKLRRWRAVWVEISCKCNRRLPDLEPGSHMRAKCPKCKRLCDVTVTDTGYSVQWLGSPHEIGLDKLEPQLHKH